MREATMSATLLRRFLFAAMLAGLVAAAARADDRTPPAGDSLPLPGSELADYVARPDASTSWREIGSGRVGQAEVAEYVLTSQTWRGIQWKHQLFVLRPANMKKDERHALLFIHGGRWKPEYETPDKQALPREAELFVRLANAIGAPVAVLRQVPFAPMFDRREDALIAYTFDRYLQTADSDWPVLLPMVKAAVRAMDAVQSIARERWGASLESFTVSGASKRGWTTWLTAATDSRVMAVAPMVIDVLNMGAQMDHQRETWGDVSDQIRDYSALDIPARLRTPQGAALLSIVDPYSYRERLTQPKLILLSTNDRYWPLDALKLYWPGLPGPKHVLYVPNQGHGLRDTDRVIGGVSALHRYAAAGKPLPGTNWSFSSPPSALRIQVRADRPVQGVRIWSARSPTLDFRSARWMSSECRKDRDGYTCSAARASGGYTAAFAETTFRDKGSPLFSTTTTVCIARPDAGSVGLPDC